MRWFARTECFPWSSSTTPTLTKITALGLEASSTQGACGVKFLCGGTRDEDGAWGKESRAARGTRVQVLILLIFQYGSCYKGHVFWQGMNIVIVIIMILLLLLLLLYYHSMFGGQPQLHLCAHLNNGATPYSMNNILKYFQVYRMRLCCSWKHFTYVATRRYFIRALTPISGK